MGTNPESSANLLSLSPTVEVLSTEDTSMRLQLNEPKLNEEDRHLIDACRDLRMLVYGESSPQLSNNELKCRRRGTLQELEPLAEFLCRPGAEISYDFELSEFIEFFRGRGACKSNAGKSNRSHRHRAALVDDPAAENAHFKFYLTTRVEDLRKRDMEERGERWMPSLDNCSLGEMLRLLWPDAGMQDVAHMKALLTLAVLGCMRIETPAMLPQDNQNVLIRHYNQLASRGGHGFVSYADFAHAGLADAETTRELRHRYDLNRDGRIQLNEFLEMLCPNGFRVHEQQCRALSSDVQPLSRIAAESGGERFSGWLFDSDLDRLPATFYQMVKVKFPEDHQNATELT